MPHNIKKLSYELFSFIINILFWALHPHKISDVKRRYGEIESLRTFDQVRTYMEQFQWVEDKPVDWKPWLITVLARDLRDDCDGAAVLGQYLFGQIGHHADLYRLTGPKEAHMVTITSSKEHMISNNNLESLHKTTWEEHVLSFFDNRYTEIRKW